MDFDILNRLIKPWSAHWNEEHQRYFYFNQETQKSDWELPKEYLEKIEKFQTQYDEEKQRQELKAQQAAEEGAEQDEEDEDEDAGAGEKNMDEFLPTKVLSTKNKSYKEDQAILMTRPARKQVETSLASQIAYRQGDEEYNIWYDKFTTDQRTFVREREAAQTRCDPELDTGYTKADLYDKHSTYFCVHFSKGCCCEGSNCRFFHRVPSLQECLTIDQSRDIFGRQRHAKHRDDLSGVGSFMVETRTLYINEFRMAKTPDGVHAMYEILWRHFSAFGEIEDIIVKMHAACAFVRFQHRCMAEFAKEAMQNQSLDSNEVILVRWALDGDAIDKSKERRDREDKKLLRKALEKEQRINQLNDHKKIMEQNREKYEKEREERDRLKQKQLLAEIAERERREELRKQEALLNVQRMQNILDKIDDSANQNSDQ